MHILCMTGIHNGNSFAIESVGKVPFVGVGHVITFPTRQCGFAPKERAFNTIDREHRIVYVAFQIIFIVCVTILFRHITVKRIDFLCSTRFDDIMNISHLRR